MAPNPFTFTQSHHTHGLQQGYDRPGMPGASHSRAKTGLVQYRFNSDPASYLNYLAGKAGLNIDTTNPFGKFASTEFTNIQNAYDQAINDNPKLKFTKFLRQNPYFGQPKLTGNANHPGRVGANVGGFSNYLTHKYYNSDLATRGIDPSNYGAGYTRWATF